MTQRRKAIVLFTSVPLVCSLVTLLVFLAVRRDDDNTGLLEPLPVRVALNVSGTVYHGQTHQNAAYEKYLGIRYGEARRFERPRAVPRQDLVNAGSYGPTCMQSIHVDFPTSEDCLFLNVWRPSGSDLTDANAPPPQGLPVMVWIYGGSLTSGASNQYDGDGIIAASLNLKLPVIYVSFNYRLGIFGFPIGRDAIDNNALNLGFYDQRLAIEWVRDNIHSFGGDPSKITIFGESAGATSVSYQMLYRGGDVGGAFRGAIMQSCAPSCYRSDPADTPARQEAWNRVASALGCMGNPNIFECVRNAELGRLHAAHLSVYGVNPPYQPKNPYPTAFGPAVHPGDDFLPDYSSSRAWSHQFAKVPFISGNNLDEGTLFVSSDPKTQDDIVHFFNRQLPGLVLYDNESDVRTLLGMYSSEPGDGSPYNTGDETFGMGREYKREASMYGDLIFHAPRREFLTEATAAGQDVWAYLFTEPDQSEPENGVAHGVDMPFVFQRLGGGTDAQRMLSAKIIHYWLNFVYYLNPSPPGESLPTWPPYGSDGNMMTLASADESFIQDNFRADAIDYIRRTASLFR
ncbi:hypothetical protein BOTBODRAFT_554878 [Botryobasidium botryosum FD-172 SS1]|uniref:Carboxylic ester hydrolase n=1 Tax=Botryobasidium botryosum (strain FD-172 SS1) TaxID=930990 RepID=A0A067MRQ8_BOTB1|nr:hypothetical protein BOTBODRAFT_554878 [Botryobasidium botryosum FD-172 SS1]